MSTFIPPTPAATKSAEQHEEPSEQISFNHLLYKVLRLTSEQVQDLNDWMKHRGIPNVHEIVVQNFRNPHALQDDLMRALLTQPILRQPLLTLYWQWSINLLIPLMMMLQTSPRFFQLRGLDRSKSANATSSSMPITPTINW